MALAMRRLTWLLPAAVVAVLAVGVASRGEPGDGPRATPSQDERARAQRPLLVVEQSLDEAEGYPIEGAVSFPKLRGPGVMRFDSRFSHQTFEVVYPLRLAGTFVLTSYQRVCAGNCGELEPPDPRCRRRFRVRRREVITARVRVGFETGCSIRIEGSRSATP
jgi:hypothetical protein